MSTKPIMAYFGPWASSGHYWFSEHGYELPYEDRQKLPWKNYEVDGILQPDCYLDRDGRWQHNGPQTEGEALVHHKDGWTAISFWDRTVDDRFGSNSTYIAEGMFTFEQMVELASTRFAVRWNKMPFKVSLKQ